MPYRSTPRRVSGPGGARIACSGLGRWRFLASSARENRGLPMWMGLLIAVASATAPDTGALAVTPYLRTLSASDGLPSSEVLKLAEDRRGLSWLSTEAGLARYDGVGFRVWRDDPADPGSIAGNDVS